MREKLRHMQREGMRVERWSMEDYLEWKSDLAESYKKALAEQLLVVGMYLRDGGRAKEVAAATEMSESAVRNMSHAARERLRVKRERQRLEQKRLEIKRFGEFSQGDHLTCE